MLFYILAHIVGLTPIFANLPNKHFYHHLDPDMIKAALLVAAGLTPLSITPILCESIPF